MMVNVKDAVSGAPRWPLDKDGYAFLTVPRRGELVRLPWPEGRLYRVVEVEHVGHEDPSGDYAHRPVLYLDEVEEELPGKAEGKADPREREDAARVRAWIEQETVVTGEYRQALVGVIRDLQSQLDDHTDMREAEHGFNEVLQGKLGEIRAAWRRIQELAEEIQRMKAQQGAEKPE